MSFIAEVSIFFSTYNQIFTSLFCFIIGYISAFATFTFYFKDSFKILFISFEAQFYSLFSGLFALFALQLIIIIKFSIMDITFNEHPFILAVIVGVAGHKMLLSLFESKGDFSDTINIDFKNFFNNIQLYLFRHYAVKREARLHEEVTEFMSEFPSEKLHELIFSCLIIVKEINEDDSFNLVDRIGEIMSYELSEENRVISVGKELAKCLDIKLIKQFAEQVSKDEKFIISKKKATEMLHKIKNRGIK